MSKKGQHNQSGISFQNKVALLYMLDHYRYADFLKIKLEGDNFEDFTLFFSRDTSNQSSFFYDFEVKNWNTPLTIGDVKSIIKKEVEKGISRYSNKDNFFIVAPFFKDDCKSKISEFKKNYFFNSDKDFNSVKNMYRNRYGDHPLLQWNREEILFVKHISLVELNEDQINNMIIYRFHYEDSFFYTVGNIKNIIGRFSSKITDASAEGEELSKQKIKHILNEFYKEEMQKSESYNLNQDLGSIAQNINEKIKTAEGFEQLNDNKYITPISGRIRAIFYIIDELKKNNFPLKSIKWFIDKILIKQIYFFQSLDLLEGYIERDSLEQDDLNIILEFIFKIYGYESDSSPIYKYEFDSFYCHRVFKILLKISKKNISGHFKDKISNFLKVVLPDWKRNYTNYGIDNYKYNTSPHLIKNLLGYTEKGVDFIFGIHNFTIEREELTSQNIPYYDYIEKFINQDFKNNFKLVIKKVSEQFKWIYKKQCDTEYEGYELDGGGYSSAGGRCDLHVLPIENFLFQCIDEFYDQTNDWEYLKPIIYSQYNEQNPIFVKRSFIPFLLKQVRQSSEESHENNQFYKALEFIIEIKDGLPFTEDVVANELYKRADIKDIYLERIINKILYKDSNDGITYNNFLIQLIIQLIEGGKLQFKDDLKRIFLNNEFQKSYRYEQALRVLEGKIENQNIKIFFNEIKDQIDISQNRGLLYEDITSSSQSSTLDKLFKSSSKADLDKLAGVIQEAMHFKNNDSFIKKILGLIKDDLTGFYERASHSQYLKSTIAELAEQAVEHDVKLAEDIIELCINDTDPCGENEELHKRIMREEGGLTISTMRAHLCYSIRTYIIYNSNKADEKSLKNLTKAFSWIKVLMDLDGSLSDRMSGFPKPNYYLRHFATIPLAELSYYNTRKRLNECGADLGNEIKAFALTVLEQTEKEIEKNKCNPGELLKRIGTLFDIIRDLNEEEAKKVLSFIKKFNVMKFAYLFIYYALFREKYHSSGGDFKSEDFKELLKEICIGKPNGLSQSNKLKECVSFSIYKDIENKNEETQKTEPDFDFFEEVKDYWVLLFENPNKGMELSLFMSLSFVLNHNESYYDNYKKYLFKFIKETLKDIEGSDDGYFLYWNEALNAVSKHNPDDLTEILLLFLKKGDDKKGYIPFRYEVESYLISEIKKSKDEISENKLRVAKNELQKYNISLHE